MGVKKWNEFIKENNTSVDGVENNEDEQKMYKIEITNATNKTVKTFLVKTDAEKEKKSLIKRFNLTRQKGFWGNSKTGTELSTNY